MPMHDPQLWRMEKVLPLLYFSPSLSLSVETISSGGVDCGTLNAATRLLIAVFLHLSPQHWDGVEEVEPRNCCRPLPSQLAVNPANRRIFLRSKLAPLPPRRLKPLYEFLCEPRPPSLATLLRQKALDLRLFPSRRGYPSTLVPCVKS